VKNGENVKNGGEKGC